MIKFYISEGLLIATVIGCLIANRQNKRKISELKAEVDVRLEEATGKVNNALNRIDTLEFKCAELKKERIDNWVDTASDILEGQQDSIDRVERKAAELAIYSKAHSCEIAEIKEILEKTAGVKFTPEEEE